MKRLFPHFHAGELRYIDSSGEETLKPYRTNVCVTPKTNSSSSAYNVDVTAIELSEEICLQKCMTMDILSSAIKT